MRKIEIFASISLLIFFVCLFFSAKYSEPIKSGLVLFTILSFLGLIFCFVYLILKKRPFHAGILTGFFLLVFSILVMANAINPEVKFINAMSLLGIAVSILFYCADKLENTKDEKITKKQIEPNWQKWATIVSAIAAVFLVIATLLLWNATNNLSTITGELKKATEDASLVKPVFHIWLKDVKKTEDGSLNIYLGLSNWGHGIANIPKQTQAKLYCDNLFIGDVNLSTTGAGKCDETGVLDAGQICIYSGIISKETWTNVFAKKCELSTEVVAADDPSITSSKIHFLLGGI